MTDIQNLDKFPSNDENHNEDEEVNVYHENINHELLQNVKRLEFNIGTTFHEIIHILGMDSFINRILSQLKPYNYDLKGSTDKNGKAFEYYELKSPKILNFIQKHFDCSKIKSVIPELNGGPGTQGSHWSRSVFMNDLFTGDDISNSILSGITLALLDDTDWYITEKSFEEPLVWGKNAGCDFYNHLLGLPSNPSISENDLKKLDFEKNRHLCQGNMYGGQGCSINGDDIGICGPDGLTKLMYYQPSNDHLRNCGSILNKGSKISMEGSDYVKIPTNYKKCLSVRRDNIEFEPQCSEMVCETNEKLKIYFDDGKSKVFKTEDSGKTITYNVLNTEFSFKVPNIADYCAVKNNDDAFCLKDKKICNTLELDDLSGDFKLIPGQDNSFDIRGACVFKKCICLNGFSGDHCENIIVRK